MFTNLFVRRWHHARTALIGVSLGVSLIAAGCSSSASIGAATTTSNDAETTTSIAAEPTITAAAAPDTTLAATTTTEAPTTTAPAAEPLILRGDGVGPFDLGMPYADVSAGLSARLEPTTDEALEFPVVDDYGGYRSADESQGFVAPFGRLACWSDGGGSELCAAFGGADPGTLTFAGWTYGGAVLTTVSGATGGSTWSAFPSMLTPGQGGCFSNSSGSIDGVIVLVVSSGTTFGSYDDAGNFVPSDPDPADVSITQLLAGDSPFDTNADC